MPWTNQILVLFHGTTTVDLSLSYLHLQGFTIGRLMLNSNTPFNILLSKCRASADFGLGFYTTTSQHQAKQWANNRLNTKLLSSPSSEAAIVLRFEVSRDWLSSLEMLNFTMPSYDFYEFVDFCRDPTKRPHGRTGGRVDYDVVCGPVRLNGQRLVIQDCDQVSFHTQHACDQLIARVDSLAPLVGSPRPGFF